MKLTPFREWEDDTRFILWAWAFICIGIVFAIFLFSHTMTEQNIKECISRGGTWTKTGRDGSGDIYTCIDREGRIR